MARTLPIVSITPSAGPGSPAELRVALDYSQLFHGREWISAAGARSPWWTYDRDTGTATPPPPAGTTELIATTFDLVDNARYSGRYTVFTRAAPADPVPSSFDGVNTVIRVAQAVAAPGVSDPPDVLTTGSVTNISTYLISVSGESALLLLEGRALENRGVRLYGRLTQGWGEDFAQTLMSLAQCSAGPAAPPNPFQGQLWYQTTTSSMFVWTGAPTNTWLVVAGGAPPPAATSYRHVQSVASTSWTVTHSLSLPAPFIAQVGVFVNTVDGLKPMLPADMTLVDANTLTLTFSNPETGYALVTP
jgi:hypothetical protein